MISSKGDPVTFVVPNPKDLHIADTYCEQWESTFWDNLDDPKNATGEAPDDKGEVEGLTEPEKKINKLAYGNPRGYVPPNPKAVVNPWLPPELDPNYGKEDKKAKARARSIKKNKKRTDSESEAESDTNKTSEAKN